MARGSQQVPGIKSWPVADKQPRTGVHVVPDSIMIVKNRSGVSGIVDMQGALGLANDSCQGLVELDPSKTPRLRIHDMGRDHAGAPVDAARAKSSHCVEVRKLTSHARETTCGGRGKHIAAGLG